MSETGPSGDLPNRAPRDENKPNISRKTAKKASLQKRPPQEPQTPRKRPGPKLSPGSADMREHVAKSLQGGGRRISLDVPSLATKYGVSENAIWKALYSLGKIPTHRIPTDIKETLKTVLTGLWERTDISMQDIADAWGVELNTLGSIRRQLNLPPRNSIFVNRLMADLPRLISEGMPTATIAAQYNLGESTVRRKIKELKETQKPEAEN